MADQAFDFRLNVSSPTYFAGTKLRDVELISSIDYGSNTLWFDAAAINAINPDRVLFLTPDASDIIYLSSSFQRNTAFDTSYSGSFWSAYAAASLAATPASSKPPLVYVRTPDGQSASSWLSSSVRTVSTASTALTLDLAAAPEPTLDLAPDSTPAVLSVSSAAAATPDPTVPAPSEVSGAPVVFGDGLTLTAFRTSANAGSARFRLSRSGSSTSQLVAYSSSSLNALAELGPDASPVAGLIRLEKGQTFADITVPTHAASLAARGTSSLSLNVEEIADQGQSERHLVLSAAASPNGSVPVLSGFGFSIDPSGNSADLFFRADVNNPADRTLSINVAQRTHADDTALSQSRSVTIRDAATTAAGAVTLDRDGRSNQQVSTRLNLDLTAKGTDPALILQGPSLLWSSPAAASATNTLSFQETVNLTAWRADHGSTAVSFSLSSGGTTIPLLQNASGGGTNAITPLSALNDDPLTGWRASEGVAVGSRQSSLAQALPDLKGRDWTPTASRNGLPLALQTLTVEGNRITASFAEGVILQLSLETITKAPSTIPVQPQVTIQRLGAQANAIALYAVDSITGNVGDLKPGDTGYLQAALARSKGSNLFLDPSILPGYAAEKTYQDLPLDGNRQYGVLLLVNGTTDQIFSSYAAANPGGTAQAISLGSTTNGMVLGFEDLPISSSGTFSGRPVDADFNDIILRIHNLQVPLA